MIRDLTGPGTPESAWAAAGVVARVPVTEVSTLLPDSGRIVVLAPHPDDEILGAGGALALLASLGARIEVIAVSDGEASHPGRVAELRRVRAAERTAALGRLGLAGTRVHRLGEPDGKLHAERIAERVAALIFTDDVVLAPWCHDGHPDHDACGEAAGLVATRRWSYLVWTWHWAAAGDGGVDPVPWHRAHRIELPDQVAREKRAAAHCFNSQLTGDSPILPPHVLARLLRANELLLEETS